MKHFKEIQSLSDVYHFDLKHPLIDIQKFEETDREIALKQEPMLFDFYRIAFVNNFNGYIEIGGTKFYGENGVLHFVEPGQVYTCNSTNPWKGYQILIHPDLFNEQFAHKKIQTYDFFSYDASETLLLDHSEKLLVSNLMEMACNEFQSKADTFSMPIILSYISTLLNLAERFYARQFDTRKTLHNQLSKDFFNLLDRYYAVENNAEQCVPSVQFFAERLNVTPNYLSDSLKHDSGQPALSIIHDYIIKLAKNRLKTTNQTIAEISFQLGFEYPNYFSRLFKRKTNCSPSEYRKSVKSI